MVRGGQYVQGRVTSMHKSPGEVRSGRLKEEPRCKERSGATGEVTKRQARASFWASPFSLIFLNIMTAKSGHGITCPMFYYIPYISIPVKTLFALPSV